MAVQRSVVKWFDAKKGYGFIVHPEDGTDVFVHYSQIMSDRRFKTLRTGEEIEFELYDGPKGLHAHKVVSLSPLPELDEETPGDMSMTEANTHRAAGNPLPDRL